MNGQIKRVLAAASCTLIVPVLSLLIARWQGTHLERILTSAITNDDPNLVRSVREIGLTLAGACKSRLADRLSDLCFRHHMNQYVELIAFLALFIGLVLIVASFVVPFGVRGNRKALAVVFGPTVRLLVVGIGISIILQGALAAYGIYALETSMTGRLYFQHVVPLGLGGLLFGIIVLGSALPMVKARPMPVFGLVIDREREPRLFGKVDTLAAKVGAAPPDNIVLGLEPTFYVTASRVALLADGRTLTGTTLFLSVPLCRIIDESELDAIIGHELGHFVGEDVIYSKRFAPAYAALAKAMGDVRSNVTRIDPGTIFSLPAVAMLGISLFEFATVERAIGRQRELEADRVASVVAGPRALSTALLKLGLYAPLWVKVMEATKEAIGAGGPVAHVPSMFRAAAFLTGPSRDRSLGSAGLTDAATPHPVDTHPPTGARIEALGIALASITAGDLDVPEEDAAAAAFAALDLIEKDLTERACQWLIATRQASLPLDGLSRQVRRPPPLSRS